MTDFFPFGTQYHRAPTPLPEEWAGDLKEIAKVGYTHVQYRPQWRWHERVRGQYGFDDLDRLFDLAAENSLRVVLKPMLETAPDWVFQELGGTRIGFHGVPISPVAIGSFYVGGWLPCFDNPAVMGSARAFVQALVERYREHEALWFYDAWNEPRSRPLGQCHCDHSVKSYQAWLGTQLGSIEAINEKFGKAWTSLQSVRPPASAGDHVEMFLWRQWAAHAVAQHVDGVVQTMRKTDPKRMVLAHVGFCSVLQDPACDASDDVLVASKADRYGTSFPVNLWPTTPSDHLRGELINDWLRRVDPQYWCHEFYPNEANWVKPPDPAILQSLIWRIIAGGTAGFTFWQFRSERFGDESNGWGMREINGNPTPRSEVCDHIANVLRDHGHKLASTQRPPARVGLVYSRASDLLGRIETLTHEKLEQAQSSDAYPYKRALYASHTLYQLLGHTTEMIVPGDSLAGRELVHVSAMEIVDEATAGQLRDYVQGGGKLIVEYPFACRDDRTWVAADRPAHQLSDLLGCREASRVQLRSDTADVRFENQATIQAATWRVELEPTGGRPIAWWPDGSCAGVRHAVGAGEVYTLGVNLSLSAKDTWDDPALDVLDDLLRQADIVPEQEVARGVLIRRRGGGGRDIWFVMNVSPQSAQVTLPAEPVDVWESLHATLAGGDLSLAPGAVWVGELPDHA